MRSLILFGLCLLATNTSIGQDAVDNTIILDQQGQPQRILSLPTVRTTYSSPYASPGVVTWSYGGMNAELIDYLASENIRKQLEFSDEQNKEYKQLQKEYGQEIKDLYVDLGEQLKQKNLPSAAQKALNEKVRLAGQKLKKEFSEKIKERLIPQQVSLIQSLRFKQSIQMFGFSHAISNKPFAEELKTTEAQKKELAKIKKEANEEIQKMMAEIRAKAKGKMLKVLDKDQRKKIKELEGDDKQKGSSRL